MIVKPEPPMDEVLPLQCFICNEVFKPADNIQIKNMSRDTGGYNWTWLDNRDFDSILFDGLATYAIHKECGLGLGE